MTEETTPPEETAAPANSGANPGADSSADPAAHDVPPARLAVHPASPHFHAEALQRGVGIRFKGQVRRDIEEYSIPEGWVRVQAGKTVDRKGRPLLIKLTGPVEAWFEDLGEDPPIARAE